MSNKELLQQYWNILYPGTDASKLDEFLSKLKTYTPADSSETVSDWFIHFMSIFLMKISMA